MSVFFYAFILFFLPFGVSNYDPNHSYTLAFLGQISIFFGMALVTLILNEFAIKPLFVKSHRWPQVVIWSIWTLIVLGLVMFYTYNYLGNWHDYSFKSALEFIANCSAVFIFPMVGTFFYFRYQALKTRIDHILITKENSTNNIRELIEFKGQGASDQITLSLEDFLYGQSQDNYVELFYVEKGQISKFLIRTSMSQLTESLSYISIVRCHRSFVINLFNVKAVKGAAKDLKLFMTPFDTEIPVSKSYREQVLVGLKSLKHFN